MFETIDPIATDTIESLDSMFANGRDFWPGDLAIVSRALWADADARRATERALMERARELAAEGWQHPQDRRIRAGLRIAGDGTVWATLRHAHEHVTVLVAVEAESIPFGADPVLDAVRSAAQAAAGVYMAERRAEAAERIARRIARHSRTTEFGARMRRAAFVPGTREHGERLNWLAAAERFRTEASWHRTRHAGAVLTWRSAAQRVAERMAEGGAA